MSTTVTSSYLNRSTPGVYITEIAAFGNSIVGVATAVPVFIGYTQFAGDPTTGAALYNTPVPITSMTEFTQYFGGAAVPPYYVAPGMTGAGTLFTANYTSAVSTSSSSASSSSSSSTSGTGSSSSGGGPTFTTAATQFTLAAGSAPAASSSSSSGDSSSSASSTSSSSGVAPVTTPPPPISQFNLYWAMVLFFANGGNQCYVVSVGSYWSNQWPTTLIDPVPSTWLPAQIAEGSFASVAPGTFPNPTGLLYGLYAAGYAVGPTMTVIPEACMLPWSNVSTAYGDVVCKMIAQASTLQDRVAILDLPGCLSANSLQALQTCQTNLSNAIAPEAANLSYACAYAPALNTSAVTTSDILFTSLLSSDNSVMNNILTTQAVASFAAGSGQLSTVQSAIAAAFPLTGGPSSSTAQYSAASGYAACPVAPPSAVQSWQLSVDNLLSSALPVYKQIKQLIANTMNVAAPSGIMAGVWTTSDAQSGVWNAPANIALATVISPLYNMSDSEQAGFNKPINGEAIDIIRAQPSRGNVVWGARTLDGNSNDYRYIQVRRTLIYVEQSIKLALQPYVFAANDSITWATVTANISSFLTGLWQQGGLMGDKPSDAFTVSCGLGSTMTAQNILDGYMVVAVTLQMIHPAEFIELTFTQTMGS